MFAIVFLSFFSFSKSLVLYMVGLTGGVTPPVLISDSLCSKINIYVLVYSFDYQKLMFRCHRHFIMRNHLYLKLG